MAVVGGAAMTRRLPVRPAPGPLEDYAARFDDRFGARAQREGFRRYLEGLLLPAERNKTLTALAGQHRADGRGAAQRSAEPAMVPFGVRLGPKGGQRTPAGALVRRTHYRADRERRIGNRRARGSQMRQENCPRRQAMAGQHRQDRQWSGERYEPVGR